LDLALTEIDLEWERKRPEYMITTGLFYGGRLDVPTKAQALVGSTVLGMLGVGIAIGCWVTVPEVGLLPGGLFGGLLLLASLIHGGWYYWKVAEYERAEAEYQRRREAAKAKHKAEDQTQREESSP
jgi:hypothetical protein